MSDGDIFTQLTEETFNNIENDSVERADDFMMDNKVVEVNFKQSETKFNTDTILDFMGGVKIQEGHLDLKSKCYRFNVNGFNIDFPFNWSAFKFVDEFQVSHLYGSELENELADVLKLVMDVSVSDFILIRSKLKLKIVAFKSINYELSKSLADIYNLEIKNIENQEIKKAA